MNLKRLMSLMLALMLVLSMAACGSGEPAETNPDSAETTGTVESTPAAEQSPETVTVSTVYGDVEVPFAPERICALDITVLDFIHALGLGENVAFAKSGKNSPAYLADYLNSDAVVLIQGTKNKGNKGGDRNGSDESAETRATEATEAADPYEMYYSIDADLIIATADSVDAELYAVLSQLAPTVVLEMSADSENLYESVKETAAAIASIWGIEEELASQLAAYDDTYAQLCEAVQGIQVVVLKTSIGEDRVQLQTDEAYGILMCKQMGMELLTTQAPADVLEASVFDRNAEEGAQVAKNALIASWIEETAPAYILTSDRTYDSIEAALAEGFSCATLDNLTATKEGRLCQIPNSAANSLGLYGVYALLDQLSAFFLG